MFLISDSIGQFPNIIQGSDYSSISTSSILLSNLDLLPKDKILTAEKPVRYKFYPIEHMEKEKERMNHVRSAGVFFANRSDVEHSMTAESNSNIIDEETERLSFAENDLIEATRKYDLYVETTSFDPPTPITEFENNDNDLLHSNHFNMGPKLTTKGSPHISVSSNLPPHDSIDVIENIIDDKYVHRNNPSTTESYNQDKSFPNAGRYIPFKFHLVNTVKSYSPLDRTMPHLVKIGATNIRTNNVQSTRPEAFEKPGRFVGYRYNKEMGTITEAKYSKYSPELKDTHLSNRPKIETFSSENADNTVSSDVMEQSENQSSIHNDISTKDSSYSSATHSIASLFTNSDVNLERPNSMADEMKVLQISTTEGYLEKLGLYVKYKYDPTYTSDDFSFTDSSLIDVDISGDKSVHMVDDNSSNYSIDEILLHQQFSVPQLSENSTNSENITDIDIRHNGPEIHPIQGIHFGDIRGKHANIVHREYLDDAINIDDFIDHLKQTTKKLDYLDFPITTEPATFKHTVPEIVTPPAVNGMNNFQQDEGADKSYHKLHDITSTILPYQITEQQEEVEEVTNFISQTDDGNLQSENPVLYVDDSTVDSITSMFVATLENSTFLPTSEYLNDINDAGRHNQDESVLFDFEMQISENASQSRHMLNKKPPLETRSYLPTTNEAIGEVVTESISIDKRENDQISATVDLFTYEIVTNPTDDNYDLFFENINVNGFSTEQTWSVSDTTQTWNNLEVTSESILNRNTLNDYNERVLISNTMGANSMELGAAMPTHTIDITRLEQEPFSKDTLNEGFAENKNSEASDPSSLSEEISRQFSRAIHVGTSETPASHSLTASEHTNAVTTTTKTPLIIIANAVNPSNVLITNSRSNLELQAIDKFVDIADDSLEIPQQLVSQFSENLSEHLNLTSLGHSNVKSLVKVKLYRERADGVLIDELYSRVKGIEDIQYEIKPKVSKTVNVINDVHPVYRTLLRSMLDDPLLDTPVSSAEYSTTIIPNHFNIDGTPRKFRFRRSSNTGHARNESVHPMQNNGQVVNENSNDSSLYDNYFDKNKFRKADTRTVETNDHVLFGEDIRDFFKSDDTDIPVEKTSFPYEFMTTTEQPAHVTNNSSPNPTTKYDENPATEYNENHTHTEYDENPTTEYDENPTTEYNENLTTEYDENPTTEYDETPTTEYDENSTTEYDENSTTEYDENSTTEYDENSTTEYDENSTTEYDENPATEYVSKEKTTLINWDYESQTSTVIPVEEDIFGYHNNFQFMNLYEGSEHRISDYKYEGQTLTNVSANISSDAPVLSFTKDTFRSYSNESQPSYNISNSSNRYYDGNHTFIIHSKEYDMDESMNFSTEFVNSNETTTDSLMNRGDSIYSDIEVSNTENYLDKSENSTTTSPFHQTDLDIGTLDNLNPVLDNFNGFDSSTIVPYETEHSTEYRPDHSSGELYNSESNSPLTRTENYDYDIELSTNVPIETENSTVNYYILTEKDGDVHHIDLRNEYISSELNQMELFNYSQRGVLEFIFNTDDDFETETSFPITSTSEIFYNTDSSQDLEYTTEQSVNLLTKHSLSDDTSSEPVDKASFLTGTDLDFQCVCCLDEC